MAKHEALRTHIESLRNAIPELRGVLLASSEGLPVAHSLSNGTDPNRVAAMAAAASSLGKRIPPTCHRFRRSRRWPTTPIMEWTRTAMGKSILLQEKLGL